MENSKHPHHASCTCAAGKGRTVPDAGNYAPVFAFVLAMMLTIGIAGSDIAELSESTREMVSGQKRIAERHRRNAAIRNHVLKTGIRLQPDMAGQPRPAPEPKPQ